MELILLNGYGTVAVSTGLPEGVFWLTPVCFPVPCTAPPPPKRAPTTALTLRSKSMTSELEELGKKVFFGKHAGLVEM